jgi:hypothetical protein
VSGRPESLHYIGVENAVTASANLAQLASVVGERSREGLHYFREGNKCYGVAYDTR